MTNAVAPLSLLAGTERLGKDSEGWSLIGPPAEGVDREFRIRIEFSLEFSGPPVVHLSVVGFDIDNGDFARLRVSAQYIDRTGFTLLVSTSWSTQVHGVDVGWLALGT
jgi:hypothetical protein